MLRAVTTLLSPPYEPVAVKPTIAVSPWVPDDTTVPQSGQETRWGVVGHDVCFTRH